MLLWDDAEDDSEDGLREMWEEGEEQLNWDVDVDPAFN